MVQPGTLQNHVLHPLLSAPGAVHLVLLHLHWRTVPRAWGKDRHCLPDTQLRALPTQPLINSIQLNPWPLSIRSALSPGKTLGTQSLAAPNLGLVASLPEPTGMMAPSFWSNHCFSQHPKGLAPCLHFKILGFKSIGSFYLRVFYLGGEHKAEYRCCIIELYT